jgi:anti-anti-sigma regulatory factor
MLALELLQWQQDRDAFEDRAIEFAVAFEQSPPSWEPPVAEAPKPAAAAGAGDRHGHEDEHDDVLAWSGVMTGPAAPQLAQLGGFAEGRTRIALDMRDVERIDWVCAGALLNAIHRIEATGKTVQIAGATPIIRALLLLIGIPYQQFVRKIT